MSRTSLIEYLKEARRRLAENEVSIQRHKGAVEAASQRGRDEVAAARVLEALRQERVHLALEVQRLQDQLSSLADEN